MEMIPLKVETDIIWWKGFVMLLCVKLRTNQNKYFSDFKAQLKTQTKFKCWPEKTRGEYDTLGHSTENYPINF